MASANGVFTGGMKIVIAVCPVWQAEPRTTDRNRRMLTHLRLAEGAPAAQQRRSLHGALLQHHLDRRGHLHLGLVASSVSRARRSSLYSPLASRSSWIHCWMQACAAVADCRHVASVAPQVAPNLAHHITTMTPADPHCLLRGAWYLASSVLLPCRPHPPLRCCWPRRASSRAFLQPCLTKSSVCSLVAFLRSDSQC